MGKGKRGKKGPSDPSRQQQQPAQQQQAQQQPAQQQPAQQQPAQQQQHHEKEPLPKKQDVRLKVAEQQLSKLSISTQPSPISSATTLTYGGGSVGATTSKLNEPPSVGSVDKKMSICGKNGRKIILHANHFSMKINIPNGTIYHYDVEFKMRNGKEPGKAHKPLLVKAIEIIKKKHERDFGNLRSIVFDGKKNIYSCQKLLESKFVEKMEVPDEESRPMELTVTIQPVAKHNVNDLVEEYVQSGTTKTQPFNAVQILNIILGMTPLLRYECINRSYFNPTPSNQGSVVDIGNGKSLWIGTFQSVRLGWKPMLNIDMANRPAYEQQSVVDFAKKFLSGRNQQMDVNGLARLQGREKEKLNKELKQLKMIFRRPDKQSRNYRINGLVDSAERQKVKIDGKDVSVQTYFVQHYQYTLHFPGLPCLHVGPREKTIFLPMELCSLKKQLAPLTKKLGEEELQKVIKETAKPPAIRKQKILKNLMDINNGFKQDPYANAFGISVSSEMEEVSGRVLPLPPLKYMQNGNPKPIKFANKLPGKWNMGTEGQQVKQFLATVPLKAWGLLDLAYTNDRERDVFVDKLYEEGKLRGYSIDYPLFEKANVRNLKEVEKKFQQLYENVKAKKGNPQIIMIIVPGKSEVYPCIKFYGDAVQNVVTQFIMKKNVVGRGGPNTQTLHNICLKLNAKTGGTNHGLFERPPVMKKPVLLLGADVTHSPPTSDETKQKPSIAAMVGSCNPDASQYVCEVSVQHGTKKAIEIIEKTEEMAYNILKKFEQLTRHKPQNIIYYRDGVSEGQFIEVLNKELGDIRKACTRLNADYKPSITFLVAQKRHKTRLFVKNDKDGVGKMKNIPPGTVVDQVITHPTEYDFFLASHEGIQGTTKPTHYHVLWDDADFSMDELQSLTFNLCHIYSRCERSVSYPAPTYYAHLAAARAREHHNALLDRYHKDSSKIPVRELKKIEEFQLLNYFM